MAAANQIVVEHRKDWPEGFPEAEVVLAQDYLSRAEFLRRRQLKVINLCRSYRYLGLGYYVSLLGEARQHRVIPSVRTLTELSSKAIYRLNMAELDKSMAKVRGEPAAAGATLQVPVYFGHCGEPPLQELAREIFGLFPCPVLRLEMRFDGRWAINSVRAGLLHSLGEDERTAFTEAYGIYAGKRWPRQRRRQTLRYDLAMLHDPQEVLPPSNRRALTHFINVGAKLGINVELITRKDFTRLAEYDALFIRETTGIDHHTYRFAKKAEAEGMVVMDDPESIVRCTNKVFLAELMRANRVPVPETRILRKGALDEAAAGLAFPTVLKIPDGSFSRGVYKIEDSAGLREVAVRLFKDSDLLLAQEFLYTPFDWRIGVLDGQPLFACQYFMSKRHWQIVKHGAGGRFAEGGAKAVPLDDAPPAVLETAVRAARLIGDGLYGVDVKETPKGVFVIEVNDNPNIDGGVEDAVAGVGLYRAVLEEFIRRMEGAREREKAAQAPSLLPPLNYISGVSD